MDEKAKSFYAKVNKYGGWQQVPVNTIHAVFEDILEPKKNGFALAKRGYWSRRLNDDITQVLKLDALKGAAYGLSYGLCLAYVPYPYLPKLKWHRTPKSVTLHLREQPQSFLQDTANSKSEEELCVVDTMLGERCLRDDLNKGWAFCAPKIYQWFQDTSTLDGIVKKCNEHMRRSKNEIQYVPGAQLVRLFTCAKLGRVSDVKAELEKYLAEHGEGSLARSNLQAALSKVVAQA